MQFRLPDLGEGVHEGQIVRVHVKEGDSIREDEPLMEVETDKAAVEIPCPFTGVVSKVLVEEQQLVHVGDVMIEFAVEGVAAAPSGQTAAAAAAAPAPVAAAGPAITTMTTAPAAPGAGPTKRASPAVRRLARMKGVDLQTINGTGSGGRVTRADVAAAASDTAPPAQAQVPTHAAAPPVVAGTPAPPPPPASVPIPTPQGTAGTDQYGAIIRQPMTQARRTIARVMAESWATIPHVTDTHDADVTLLDQLRRGYESPENPGRKLTMLAFIVRAVVRALERFPEFNASFDAEAGEAVYRRYINVAIGVHTARGLIAPVIRATDTLGVIGIADALGTIAEKARNASFAVNDTRGGTYTISNPGALGTSRYSTPIITPPQVGVLGLGRTRKQPWVVDDAVVPRLILPLSHSFDHRIIDGGNELGFMRHLIDDLENPARLLL